VFKQILNNILLILFPCLLLANTTKADFCVDKITGSIFVLAENCPVHDVEVSIYDSLNQVIERVKTDSVGVYTFQGNFPCGSYSAKLTANVPECYEYLSGNRGPVSFSIIENEEQQGINFVFKRLIPTQMQWVILALILLGICILSYVFKAFRVSVEGYMVEYPFFNFFNIPFHWGIYKFMLFITSVLVMIGFIICLLVYHSVFYSDIIGTMIAGPIFAYLLHILYIVEAEK